MSPTVHPNVEAEEDLLDSKAACELLGIKPQTLYSYVSRGWIESLTTPLDRKKRYRRADLERIRVRQGSRKGHAPAAAEALRWGQPVLETSVGSVGEAGHRYRGVAVREILREGWSLEDLVAHLWRPFRGPDEDFQESLWEWSREGPDPNLPRARRAGASSILVLAPQVLELGLRDLDRTIPSRRLLSRQGARIFVEVLAAARPGVRGRAWKDPRPLPKTLAELLGRAYGVPSRSGRMLLTQALAMAADHGLNASTFAARVSASTGADLYASVAAGFCALSGPRHGDHSLGFEALLEECKRAGDVEAVLKQRFGRGESIPGFGHRLYPKGDPRGGELIDQARAHLRQDSSRGAKAARARFAVLEEVHERMREWSQPAPSLDIGLVAVCEALGLPRGSAPWLFAQGRTLGWIAHIEEQRRSGAMLRPRSVYREETPRRGDPLDPMPLAAG